MAVSLSPSGLTLGSTTISNWDDVGGGEPMFVNRVVYNSSGTFAVPANATYLAVTAYGAGGGRAGSSSNPAGGGGGAAGAIVDATALPANVAITVGAANEARNSGDGGSSSFGNYVVANGGKSRNSGGGGGSYSFDNNVCNVTIGGNGGNGTNGSNSNGGNTNFGGGGGGGNGANNVGGNGGNEPLSGVYSVPNYGGSGVSGTGSGWWGVGGGGNSANGNGYNGSVGGGVVVIVY